MPTEAGSGWTSSSSTSPSGTSWALISPGTTRSVPTTPVTITPSSMTGPGRTSGPWAAAMSPRAGSGSTLTRRRECLQASSFSILTSAIFHPRFHAPAFAFRRKSRYFYPFMHCPFCDADKESLKVIDSRTCEGGRAIRRRRQCLKCDKRFTTYERIEERVRLVVVKKDGRRVPWDRARIVSGLERACFKRPVPEGELLRITDEVEDEIFKSHDREVPSTVVGALVTD